MTHTPNAARNVLLFYRVLNALPCLAGTGPQLLDEDAMCDDFTLYDVYQFEAHLTAHPVHTIPPIIGWYT